MSTLKLSFNTFWNFTEDITHWKNFQILISKTLKISYLGKKCFFYDFSKILEFNLPLNRQVLTKCWLKYSRSIRNLLLMFFIFWIMIISPKLKKIFDGTDPPKKGLFFWGGVWRLKVQGFGVCLGPHCFFMSPIYWAVAILSPYSCPDTEKNVLWLILIRWRD